MNALVLALVALFVVLGVGLVVSYLLLLSTQVLFNWPADLGVVHVVALWFILVVLTNMFKKSTKKE